MSKLIESHGGLEASSGSWRKSLPIEEVKKRLVVKDGRVHTLVAGGGAGHLVGCHWAVEKAVEVMEELGVMEAGPHLSSLGHRFVCADPSSRRLVFFEAKEG